MSAVPSDNESGFSNENVTTKQQTADLSHTSVCQMILDTHTKK